MKQAQFKRNVMRFALSALAGFALFATTISSSANLQGTLPTLRWIEAGSGGVLPAELSFDNQHGKLGVLNTAGPIEMKGHPFFEPLGLNPRGCVTCHQPANAMSVSVESLRERWRV